MNGKRKYPYKSANNSRNHYNSNNTVINLVNIIYDDEFVSLINNLSSSLKDYFKLLNKLINNIREITSTLGNQTLYSKCLLNDCISLDKNHNTDKFIQLSDRIDIIDNNKKLLENNISLIDANMSSFLDKAKLLFKKMKVTRNSKLNNTIKKQKYIQNSHKIINNNKNEDMNLHYYSNDSHKFRRNNYSCNNARYQHPNLNQYAYQNYFCTTLKKNRTSRSYSKNLMNNNNFNIENQLNKSDYNNYNYDIDNINNMNDRQKTMNFNIRQFLFNTNQNILDKTFENSNESFKIKKQSNKGENSNNFLFNYCSLVNNSKNKNDRNMNIKENLKYKNIHSLNNEVYNKNRHNLKNMNIKNLINSNIFDYKHCWNKNNLELKNYKNKNIEYIPNYFNSLNYVNKGKESNNSNNICYSLATKVIEYFNFIKYIDNNSEEKKNKLKKMKKIIFDLCINIINKFSNHSRNENRLNLTNSVKYRENNNNSDIKNNIMNFSKIYNKNKRNPNENLFNKGNNNINFNSNRNNINNTYKDIKKDNIFRNNEEIKIYNSVGNLKNNFVKSQSLNKNLINNIQIGNNLKSEIDNKNNIIGILNNELKKKNEYITKINNILIRKQKSFNNLIIENTPKIQIIQNIKYNKNKKIFTMQKEIILFFKGIQIKYNIKNNIEIEKEKNKLKFEINNLKRNNEELILKFKEKEEENIKINNIYSNNIKEFKNIKEENEQLKKEMNNLKQNKNDLNGEIINLKNKYKDLNQQKNENNNNSQIIELKKENNNLSLENQELKNRLKNENNKTYKYKYELLIDEMNNKKNEINILNEKIEELNNNNKILTNKLDEMDFNNKSLEEERNNLKIKIQKLEEEIKDLNQKLRNGEKLSDRKIVITNSDYQPEDEDSDILYNLNDDQSQEEKNLIEINKKLQEKINQLQMELNKQILNEKPTELNHKNKILNNNYIKENSSNKINDNKENHDNIENLKNSFTKELKIKEDMIEDLQQKIIHMSNNSLNKINININQFYNHKDYIILCDKNFNNLQWFLLAPKIKDKNKKTINGKNKINENDQIYNYDNVFWVDKEHLEKEIDKYNSFTKENEEENKIIMNYIKKLEEKENLISKLTAKLSNLEKSFNYKSTNDKNLSKNRSKSSNNKPFTEVKLFEKESEEYKESEKIDEYKKSTYGSMDIEKKYYNIEEELRANKNQIQIFKKYIKELEIKMKALKESCKNFFSKIVMSKNEKEDARQILKIFEFNDNEINLIINKKRNK